MPVLTVYHHGCTAGIPGNNRGMAGKRGDVVGWSTQATKSNTAFLRSVRLGDLTGLGFAITLTIRDCPPTADDWARLRRAFIKRMERLGAIRFHWVTEWQRRGVPHLHGCVYFPWEEGDWRSFARYNSGIINAWTCLAWEYTASDWCQHVKPIEAALGWLQYLAKHAARGANHYQRNAEGIPEGWKKTGRMWGHTGDWPTDKPMKFDLDRKGFFRYRRMLRGWRVADARASEDASRLRAARSMLRGTDRALCELRGVSEWVPENTVMAILAMLSAQGHRVEQ